MRSTEELASGRDAYARFDWSEAYGSLQAADRDDDLSAGDVQRLAITAALTGHDDEAIDAWERAHHAFVAAGEIGPAVRCAFWLGMQHMRLGRHAPGAGWIGRGRRLLDDSQMDCVERGYLQIPDALRALSEGDLQRALDAFGEIRDLADRYADPDLMALARLGRGQTLATMGEATEAAEMLDAAMVAVTTGDVSPSRRGSSTAA